MATFIILLKDGDFSHYTPEEMQTILQDYLGWSDSLRARGKYKGGDELKDGGRVLTVQDGRVVDGPFTETKEVIGGYYLIEEKDLAAAVETSRECPHLKYRGRLEIREINPH